MFYAIAFMPADAEKVALFDVVLADNAKLKKAGWK
jgi:hypothetical protein